MSGERDLFGEINNAVMDLQLAHYQTYEHRVKTLARLLQHPDLSEINNRLKHDIDLDAFLDASAKTEGSMVGSAILMWPARQAEITGLTLLLIERFAEKPDFMFQFAHTYYYSGSKIIDNIRAVVSQLIVPFVRDYKTFVQQQGEARVKLFVPFSNKVFIVHGHDGEARETVARFIERLGLTAIILHEQASRGKTIIEKVEAHSDVGFAVVMLTPDDEGCATGGVPCPRPRQNVLLELGYFIGRLGRERVCALKRGDMEIPSDFAGVVWTAMDAGNGWKLVLGRELKAAGYEVDLNALVR